MTTLHWQRHRASSVKSTQVSPKLHTTVEQPVDDARSELSTSTETITPSTLALSLKEYLVHDQTRECEGTSLPDVSIAWPTEIDIADGYVPSTTLPIPLDHWATQELPQNGPISAMASTARGGISDPRSIRNLTPNLTPNSHPRHHTTGASGNHGANPDLSCDQEAHCSYEGLREKALRPQERIERQHSTSSTLSDLGSGGTAVFSIKEVQSLYSYGVKIGLLRPDERQISFLGSSNWGNDQDIDVDDPDSEIDHHAGGRMACQCDIADPLQKQNLTPSRPGPIEI
ncbi:hypothetical protein X797_007443 [Metarhizium robertsii]|uniref:Uncharacterized protein n=1 Tax=Metarhizium robertsii TaxID=568076 RepID=A0A014PP47_9HYPO|nr:hypothetical protein X797_007443 [Metarhizium robertsii]